MTETPEASRHSCGVMWFSLSGADVSTKPDVWLFVEMPQFQHERPLTKP